MITLEMIQSLELPELREELKSNEKNLDIVLDDSGGTCLHYAAWGNFPELAEMLINEFGDNVNKRDVDENTPLHYAAHGSFLVSKLLLEYGADVNAVDSEGNTALHNAIFRREEDIVRLLVEAGSEVRIKANDGVSALELAKDNGVRINWKD